MSRVGITHIVSCRRKRACEWWKGKEFVRNLADSAQEVRAPHPLTHRMHPYRVGF